MELRQLKYFIAVAEARSFTTAAKSLLVTQPTLTMAVQKLEAELESKLFHRGEQGNRLTETGQLLYDEGKPLLAGLEELSDRVRAWGTEERETIRVGLTVLFSMQLMQRIARFISTHRNVEVTLVQDGSHALQRRLAAGEIDLGVLSFPKYERDIVIDPLSGEMAGYDVAVVMRADNPLAQRESVAFADLAGQQFSSFGENFVLGRILPERMRSAGLEADVVFTNDDWEVLLTSVDNLGTLTLLPTGFERFSTHEGLAWVPLDDRANHFAVGIATRQGADHSPAVEEMIDALRRP